MQWFNVFGVIVVIAIMIPNVIYAIKCKDGFQNTQIDQRLILLEQIGRFGCIGFMIFQIPGTSFGAWSAGAFAAYLITDCILIAVYCLLWVICFRKNNAFRALALSILPAVLFLFSGIMTRSVPLILSAICFSPAHIIISYKNIEKS